MNTVTLASWLFLSASVFTPSAYSDPVRDVSQGTNDRDSGNGGYLEIGLGAFYSENDFAGADDEKGITASLGGHYQWQNLFIDLYDQGYYGIQLGYNFKNTNHWAMDILGTHLNTDISDEDSDSFDGIDTRHADFNLGIRATGYYGNYVFVGEAYTDISDTHNSNTLSVFAGRNWQVRNWLIHSGLMLRSHSSRGVDYYVGIEPHEASDTLPEYQAGSGYIGVFEAGITIPISSRWVFRTVVRQAYYSDEISNSPLIKDSPENALTAQFIFVY